MVKKISTNHHIVTISRPLRVHITPLVNDAVGVESINVVVRIRVRVVVIEPIIKIVVQGEDYTKLRLILARRPSIEHLMSLIEARQDSEDAKKASE